MKLEKKEECAGFKCSNCGSCNTDIYISLYVSYPSEWFSKLTKSLIRKKEFKIRAQSNTKFTIICNDCKRGFTY